MFKQHMEKINGYGSIIVTILLTVTLWIMGDMRNAIRDIRLENKDLASTIITYNTNHLSHHASFEIEIAQRLTCIETTLKNAR